MKKSLNASIVGLLFLLAACSITPGQSNGTLLTATEASPAATSINAPTLVRPSATATVLPPSVTPTSTITPTPTKIATPTRTPTWTPIPTLHSEEAFQKILDLYANNGGCQLPCWWGITPGVTTWREAREILGPLGSVQGPFTKTGNIEKYDTSFVVPETIDTTGLGFFETDFWVEDGIVKAISTNSSWIGKKFDYSLPGILKTLGMPDEVWMEIITDTTYTPHYDIKLFYSERGLQFGASDDAIIRGSKLLICPQKFKRGKFPPGILLWSPSKEVTFKNLDQTVLGGVTNSDMEDFYRLEDFTDEFDPSSFL